MWLTWRCCQSRISSHSRFMFQYCMHFFQVLINWPFNIEIHAWNSKWHLAHSCLHNLASSSESSVMSVASILFVINYYGRAYITPTWNQYCERTWYSYYFISTNIWFLYVDYVRFFFVHYFRNFVCGGAGVIHFYLHASQSRIKSTCCISMCSVVFIFLCRPTAH